MVDNLPTSKLRDEYIEAFGLIDRNGNGYLTKHEFCTLLRDLDPTMGGEDIEEFLTTVSLDNTQSIDIDPFTEAMKVKMKQPHPIDEVIESFKKFDPEKTGKIGFEELKQSFSVIGEAFMTIDERITFFNHVKGMVDDEDRVDYKKLAHDMFKMCLTTEELS